MQKEERTDIIRPQGGGGTQYIIDGEVQIRPNFYPPQKSPVRLKLNPKKFHWPRTLPKKSPFYLHKKPRETETVNTSTVLSLVCKFSVF